MTASPNPLGPGAAFLLGTAANGAPGTREDAVRLAEAAYDAGAFAAALARLVAVPSESGHQRGAGALDAYLDDHLSPLLAGLGFALRRLAHPAARGPFLLAERIEGAGLPTVLGYGHGDVVGGMEGDWAPGLAPWTLTAVGDRLHGRGTADNKGQHLVNLTAQAAVIRARGRLGFNAKWLFESGEEVGSPGLREVCEEHRGALAADLFLASDGPRLAAERPTIFLGSRAMIAFDLVVEARERAHHSGNWGGLLADPAMQLAHALASLSSASGAIHLPAWVPDGLADSVRGALAGLEPGGGPGDPAIDPAWGEPGLTPAERLFGWCSLAVLAMSAGRPEAPVNAVAPRARARVQLRYVVGVDPAGVLPALRRHLDRRGLGMVGIEPLDEPVVPATRLDPESPWARFAAASLGRTAGRPPAVLPNFGGTLPNDAFASVLGLPTVWVPHSHPGCAQHAPDEHLLGSVAREGLALMAGLYWDLGAGGTPADAPTPFPQVTL